MAASVATRPAQLDGLRVLVVEDERAIANGIRRLLAKAGADVSIVRTTNTARASLETGDFDLVLLDQHLPDGDGLDLLPAIEALVHQPAIIAVSAHLQDASRALALQARRAILLPKPFGREELLIAAVDALALRARAANDSPTLRRRRDETDRSPLLEFGPIAANLVTQSVTVGGSAIDVQPAQFRILVQLLTRIGTSVPFEELTGGAPRGSEEDVTASVRFQIHVLRRRLGRAGKLIQTTRHGYGIGLRTS